MKTAVRTILMLAPCVGPWTACAVDPVPPENGATVEAAGTNASMLDEDVVKKTGQDEWSAVNKGGSFYREIDYYSDGSFFSLVGGAVHHCDGSTEYWGSTSSYVKSYRWFCGPAE